MVYKNQVGLEIQDSYSQFITNMSFLKNLTKCLVFDIMETYSRLLAIPPPEKLGAHFYLYNSRNAFFTISKSDSGTRPSLECSLETLITLA